MAKNNKHWKRMMASSTDRKIAKEGRDPLEEGLEGLSWLENQKRVVKKRWNKTRETFGEEVGNSITSGVVMFYILFMIPFASLHAYKSAPEGWGDIDSFSVSAFMIRFRYSSLEILRSSSMRLYSLTLRFLVW